jgi:hypothetical protein
MSVISGTRSKMAGLERLRWLVWYNNMNGLMPIRMEVNRTTKKFERLVWSYGHPVTWWFFLVATVQTVLLIWSKMVFVPHFSAIFTNDSALTIFSVVTLSFAYIGSYYSPRLIILQFKNLAEATTYIRKFDQVIAQFGQWPCTSNLRIIGGFFIIFLSVSQTKLIYLNIHYFFFKLV